MTFCVKDFADFFLGEKLSKFFVCPFSSLFIILIIFSKAQISCLFKILYGKEEYIKDIIVTDLGSTDKTKEIVDKMSTDYECVRITNWKECKDIIDNIENVKNGSPQ